MKITPNSPRWYRIAVWSSSIPDNPVVISSGARNMIIAVPVSYTHLDVYKRQQEAHKMIYTVTFNPSLDYIVTVDDFKLGLTNRTTSELMLPGGKGINVSIVLGNLGIDNTALG